MTQQWLNETYAGTSGYSAVDEDGITGMGTIRALIWALQTELGISADGVFGDGTAKAFTALSTESDSSITTINHQIHILQGALYCKGQGLDPIYLIATKSNPDHVAFCKCHLQFPSYGFLLPVLSDL